MKKPTLIKAQEQIIANRKQINQLLAENKQLKAWILSKGGKVVVPRNLLKSRNREIYRQYQKGAATAELALKYSLSAGGIYRILRRVEAGRP